MTSAPFRQRVPRPASARPGPPPPWSVLSASRRSSVSLARVVAAARLAGCQLAATHDGTRASDDGVSAAVLVPVFSSSSRAGATVVLIRRAAQLQRDPGHVAFPGGRVEHGEAPVAAALRESEEELGLVGSAVEISGLLEVVRRPPGELVAAYLGLLRDRPVLVPNPSEVETVFEVPLASLLADGVAWQEEWSPGAHDEGGRFVRFFSDPAVLGDDLIWGVSAQILWRLLEHLVEAA